MKFSCDPGATRLSGLTMCSCWPVSSLPCSWAAWISPSCRSQPPISEGVRAVVLQMYEAPFPPLPPSHSLVLTISSCPKDLYQMTERFLNNATIFWNWTFQLPWFWYWLLHLLTKMVQVCCSLLLPAQHCCFPRRPQHSPVLWLVSWASGDEVESLVPPATTLRAEAN